MSDIFISHSSKDSGLAAQIQEWLVSDLYEAFLDTDREFGLTPGGVWQKQLKRKLVECKVLIPLCSANFRESDWCRFEAVMAYATSKDIIPILIDDAPMIKPLDDLQAIDLRKGSRQARERLLHRLKTLLPNTQAKQWDLDRPPYPGLDPFMEADALIFHGRNREIDDALRSLRTLRKEGALAFMMIIGASGSGKSSLVRAGIIPKLRSDHRWIVLDPFRPTRDPLRELVIALRDLFQELGSSHDELQLEQQLCSLDPSVFSGIVDTLRSLAGKPEASLLITIDQFEELLQVSSFDSGNDDTASGPQEIQEFLELLRRLVSLGPEQVLFVGTLRSDFLDDLQDDPIMREVKYDSFLLRPMAEENFRQTIEGPAEIAGLDIEKELVDKMIEDTKTGDALPLLAFTLRELWEKMHERGNSPDEESPRLSMEDYREIGGLEGAIQQRAEQIYRIHCSKAVVEDLRDAFLSMVRRNVEADQFVRKTAEWSDIPVAIQPTLDRFVKARLLVKKSAPSVGGQRSIHIEVAHEALLRNWPRLERWIREDTAFLEWRERFVPDFSQWRRSKRGNHRSSKNEQSGTDTREVILLGPGDLTGSSVSRRRRPWQILLFSRDFFRAGSYLSGAKLVEAERWKGKFAEDSLERKFIQASTLRREMIRVFKIVFVSALSFGLIYSLHLWQSAKDTEADQLRIRHLSTIESDPFNSGLAGLAAMGRFILTPGINHQIARGLEQALEINLAQTDLITSQLSRVDAAIPISDRKYVVVGQKGDKGYVITIGIRANGSLDIQASQPEPIHSQNPYIVWLTAAPCEGNSPETEGCSFYTYAKDANGLAYLATWDQNMKRRELPNVETPGNVVFHRGEILSIPEESQLGALISLRDGQSVVSAHQNGKFLWWKVKQNADNESILIPSSPPLVYDQEIKSLSSFVGGGKEYLVGGSDDGSLRVWHEGKEIVALNPDQTQHDQITAVVALPGGDIVTGDRRSFVRWWRWDPQQGENGNVVPHAIPLYDTNQLAITSLASFSREEELQVGDNTVISSGEDGTVRWLRHQPLPISQPAYPRSSAARSRIVAMVEIGDNLVTGHHTGDICWWNLSIQATQSLLSKCKKSGHDHLRAMVIQSSGPTLVSAGDDGKLRWWNQDKELIAVSTQSIEPIESLAVTPNGRLLSGHGNGDVRWWDHQTPLPPLERFKSSLGPVDKLVYLAGNSFVSAETSTIHWWPGGVHGEIQYDINASRITSLAKVSRTQVVSGDNNGTLQRWQQGGRLGKPVQTSHKYGVLAQVVQHELQATPPFWRPILITGGAPPEEKPATLSVWYSGLNYQENGVLPRHEVISTGQQEVQSLLKTKDGDLISGGARGSIKVLSPKKLVAEACREYKRILARPRDEVAKQASQLCNAQPPDAKWTNLWRWIPFWWHWWL